MTAWCALYKWIVYMSRCGDMVIRNYSRWRRPPCHLGFVRTGNSDIGSAKDEVVSGSYEPLRRYDHLKFFWDSGGRHLGIVETENSAIRSVISENRTLEPNMKWIGRPVAEMGPFEFFTRWRIGSPVAEIWPFAYGGGIWDHIWREGEVVGGQRWHHSKERW